MNPKPAGIVGLSIVLGCVITVAGGVQDFVADVDAEWGATNFPAMRQVIDQRLSSHTNDLPALLFKMNYHLTIDYDLSLARAFVPAFTSAVASLDWSPDYMAKVACLAIADEVLDPTESESVGVIFGMTSNELAQVHAASPTNHPLSAIVLRVGAVQYDE